MCAYAAVAIASACGPLVSQTPEQREYADDVAACQRGDGEACYTAATIALTWEGRAPGATEIAEALLGRGCDAGDPSSCRRLANRWRSIEPRTAAIYVKRACQAGDQESCDLLTSAAASTAPAAPAPAPPPPPPDPPMLTSGTCFFVARAGIAVTNHHVIDGAAELVLIDARGRAHAAKVLRDDKQVDLAVLEAVTANDVPPLPLAADKDVPLGEQVFTIGFPVPGVLGTDPKFSEGSLGGQAGLGAAWLYQVTVPVQPGNSGGPLVDHRGFVVGVIVAKLRADRLMQTEGVTPENVNFAIKSAELRRLLRGLKLGSSKAARTRQAAIDRTRVSVCHVVAKPAGSDSSGAEAAPDGDSVRGPSGGGPAAPPGADAQGVEANALVRIAGEPRVLPDAATVAEMRRRGRPEIRARVKLCIDRSGAVESVMVLDSSGSSLYDKKLTRAVKRWQYRPFMVDGEPAAVCSTIAFTYRLRSGAAPGG
ncbi:MAG: TonB family protein [Myxococcales bacterium]|nr:TonB family protein [Myxococcales bacterium]